MSVAEPGPYRPFRVIASIVVGLVFAVVVWIPLSLTEGLRFGPGERIQFESREQAVNHAFFEHGLEWPGSSVKVHERADGGLINERRWLPWSEIRLPVTAELTADTASYRYGPGTDIQEAILAGISCLAGLGASVIVWRTRSRRG
jgi:hypothetical protein